MQLLTMSNSQGKIILTLDIYKTIIATTVRYANSRIPEEEWAEVYGLLYGYNDGDNVIITEAVPFTHTKKQRHILKVEFDQEDYALAASIESEFYLRTPPQYIVGWYHSHPGIKIMLSQDDVKNQLAWQTNNPLAVALVFNHSRLVKQIEMPSRKGDPVKQLHMDPGFICFRLDDPTRGLEAAYHQIPFEFSDYEMDEPFIENARDFVKWVTKAFPRGKSILSDYKQYIASTVKKIDEIYHGTLRYAETLKRKGEITRIPGVVSDQRANAEKILNQGKMMVNIFRLMKNYLEYKERAEMIPQIEGLLAEWEAQTHDCISRFDSIN